MVWQWPADVDGWLDMSEGLKLAELASGKTVLEIGSWHGRSTISMAQVATRVHAIDWCRGDWGTGPSWTLPRLAENLRRYAVLDRVVLHVGRVKDVGPVLANDTFDMAFVDGAHDEVTATEDMRLVARLVRPGGMIALHDWGAPEVKAAAKAALGWNNEGGQTVVSLHYRTHRAIE